MASKPWDKRASTDQRLPLVYKTVEVDTSKPYLTRGASPRRNQRPSSPSRTSHHYQRSHYFSSATPSPAKSRPIQIRSASPRIQRDDRSAYNYTSNTPSLRSNYSFTSRSGYSVCTTTTTTNAALPNYMAITESAKARIRSQSAPRQRPLTPEKDRSGSARKRLSFPVLPQHPQMDGQSLRSPSFKSVGGSQLGALEQQSNYSSCCTESLGGGGGEISPASTSDYRRWLR